MVFEEFLKKAEKKLITLSKKATINDVIENELYAHHKVYRGLRDINGKGVVCGLTKISEINGFIIDEKGNKIPADGELFYRGYNIKDLVSGFIKEKRYGFEEIIYLLICGKLPTKEEMDEFDELMSGFRSLPDSFVRDIILKATNNDMMNMLARSVLTLYSYDNKANDISVENVFRQVIELVAKFPLLTVYSYQAYNHYYNKGNLVIRNPKKGYSTAENILYMLHGNNKFTELEARALDLCLVIQAEHGGGNNSTFTTHVVTSSGTDTYSAVVASLASLKGPRHGGAALKVVEMMNHIKKSIKNDNDEEIAEYLNKMLNKEVFDKTGLIYGMGHAVYSLSDPRVGILKSIAKDLAKESGWDSEFELYDKIEKIAPKIIAEKRKIYKGVCPNVDFYTGLIYQMLRIPTEMYITLFAIARVVGWGAHRIEELANNGKIIRPAYIAVSPRQEYKKFKERE